MITFTSISVSYTHLFRQAVNTCSIVCVLHVYLVCVSDAGIDRNLSNPPQVINKIIILIHCAKTNKCINKPEAPKSV